MPAPKDSIKREGWIIKNRESHLGERNPNYGKRGKETPMFGKHHSTKTRAKMSVSHTGSRRSEKTRKRQSEVKIGEKNPMFGKRGELNPLYKTHLPIETRKKISHTKITFKWIPTDEWRKKQSDGHSGEKNHSWRGGISFEPYCYMFNKPFKKRVRAFFGHKCVECEMTREENGQDLDVHHVNYNKMMCCNDVKPLFVALCRSHNAVANGNRGFWEDWYTELINEFYGGKCYLPKPVDTQ